MDADGRVNLRIGRCHHACHGAACGEARYEHTPRIDIMFGDNFAGDSGDDGRFAGAPNSTICLDGIWMFRPTFQGQPWDHDVAPTAKWQMSALGH
jgi:hypothetical protein